MDCAQSAVLQNQDNQDGLYRLDYNYLTQAGISGVNPQRFQLWRRGKEVAIYVGPNNPTTLTPATYIDFYGQRNDGALDVGMYKNPQDHYQKYYSLYTDTAAYFLTWSATTNGKRMAASSLAPVGGAHPYWLKDSLYVRSERYGEGNDESIAYKPWGEAGEGFFSISHGIGSNGGNPMPFEHNAFPGMLTTMAPTPRVEMLLIGATPNDHELTVSLLQPTGGLRNIEPPFVIKGLGSRKVRYSLQRNEINPVKYRFEIKVNGALTPNESNWFRMVYLRAIYPLASTWTTGKRGVEFQNDSTLGSAPAFYQLDNVPASVLGFDLTDPYNVQRIEPTAGTGTRRNYVFPSAIATNVSRRLMLSDLSKVLVPQWPAQRTQFRTINPASYNFLVVSSAELMAPTGNSKNPVQDYVDYRAGRYQTLLVTSEQLYDQFHYGEKSALAVRQFAQYMLTNSREKFLLLLGQGVRSGEAVEKVEGQGPTRKVTVYYYRQNPERYRDPIDTGPLTKDLVPTSTRSASDLFFTADWARNDYAGRMATGRIAASTPAEVLAYLEKLKQYEKDLDASTETQAWRKNTLNLLGAVKEEEYPRFLRYLNTYKNKHIERPLFAGKVLNTYSSAGFASFKNISAELNAGLGMITYFGHGDPAVLQLDLGNINDPSLGYNNVGKYPIMFVNGCAAGNAYRASRARYAQDWVLAPQKGLVGLMSESGAGYEDDLDALQRSVFQALLNDPAWYGRPVAQVQNEAIRRLQRNGSVSESAISSWMGTVWHADPALRMYSPQQPDYTFGTPAIEIRSVDADPYGPSQVATRFSSG
ncbi:putative type IX secretion system sortase PorU2 [Hymenobacter cellulosilyticus]|uniref:C25 family cysteine peptidase n=1 Tax=Hymenobacter cellulosilyticus TaxID=2932248 RepID=A0A8T9Q3M1_9BACT|nr:C25 family cysteine peptidase [Hymenobacter cellulosilyticus]UOQ71645.1 C25 family cysteine peptidase [Hymenobacter cellulosilyticus]